MRVNVNLTTRPKGDMIEVLHLGVFPNGETSEVDEERVAAWLAATGREEAPESLEITNSGTISADPPSAPVEPAPQPAPDTPPEQPEGVTQ